MPKAYLTIDDSPSPRTGELIDGLVERNVPALLFCRGDLLEKNPRPMVRAIQKGMVLGNHGYVHVRAGSLDFAQVCDSIEKTEKQIDRCYTLAKLPRPGKYFRFPYIDRGDGDLLERRFFDIIAAVERGDDPKIPQPEVVSRIQDYLKQQGFVQPFKGVAHPLYAVPLVRNARDCLFTYSTGDWMLNARHKGTQPMSTLDDLTKAMDADPYLTKGVGAQIVLIHDHPEIIDVALGIVDHMIQHKFEFIGV